MKLTLKLQSRTEIMYYVIARWVRWHDPYFLRNYVIKFFVEPQQEIANTLRPDARS